MTTTTTGTSPASEGHTTLGDQRATTTDTIRRMAKSPLFPPIVAALVVACIVMFILTPKFLTTSNLTNIVTQSSIVGIAAVGATFIIITGGIDLSVGSNIALSGMLAATLVGGGLNGVLGVLLTIVVAASSARSTDSRSPRCASPRSSSPSPCSAWVVV